MSLEILFLFLYILCPCGQLAARVYSYDGTLEHPWFFFPLFMLFPFQTIPVLLMHFGYIKKGKGGKVIDYYMLIPIITRIIVELAKYGIINYMITDPASYLPIIIIIFGELIMTISIMIAKYFHTDSSCNTAKIPLKADFFAILCDSLFQNGIPFIISPMLNIVLRGLQYIPGAALIVMPMQIITSTKIFKKICWFLGYMFIYVIQNMFDHSDLSSLCNNISSYTYYILKLISGLFLIVSKYYFNF